MARHWMDARWGEVTRVIADEARALSGEEKLRQLGSLMESAELFSWPAEERDDQRVRDLWRRLHAMRDEESRRRNP